MHEMQELRNRKGRNACLVDTWCFARHEFKVALFVDYVCKDCLKIRVFKC